MGKPLSHMQKQERFLGNASVLSKVSFRRTLFSYDFLVHALVYL